MRKSQSGFAAAPRWNTDTTPRVVVAPKVAPAPIAPPELILQDSHACFLVLFAKRSNKKRKSFADGVLEVNTAKLVLFDMDGKQVSQTRNLNPNAAFSLGDSLEVGANDVEISSRVPYANFVSKSVFQNAVSSLSQQQPQPQQQSLALPKFNRVGSALSGGKTMVGRPAFNPEAPGALVLRPRDERANTVAIVVDPNLSCRLRPHQREGVQFMFNCVMGISNAPGGECFGCILADEMGLGKTLQSITLIWTLLKQSNEGFSLSQPLVKKCVIVCPANLVGNWQREFNKFLGPVRLLPICITESGLKAEKDVAEFVQTRTRNVLIISFEGYRKHADVINNCAGFDLLIVDEGHRLKSSTGNKTIDALDACPTKRRVILTGTPLQNQLDEFFAVVTFVNPPALDGDVKAFRRTYQAPIEKGRDKDATAEEIALANAQSQKLAQLTRGFILRRTAEINQLLLPPKRETLVFIRLSKPQEDMYRDLIGSREVESILQQDGDGEANGTDALRLITRLKQLCTHPCLVKQEAETLMDQTLFEHSSKFQVLDAMLGEIRQRDATDRIVLVSCYTSSLDVMAKLCDLRKYKYLRMDGKTKVKERQALVNQFNAPPPSGKNAQDGPFVFLLSAKAGGCGINLVGGNRLVLMDADWNPAVDLQAMARVWRDGQTKDVHVYRFLSTGSIEERVFQRQLMKIQTASGILQGTASAKQGGLANGGPEFSRLELKRLFELRTDTKCDTFDLMRMGNEDNAVGDGWEEYMGPDDVQDDEVLRAVATRLGNVISFVHSDLFDANNSFKEEEEEEVEMGDDDLHCLEDSSESEEEKPRASKRTRKVMRAAPSSDEEEEM